MFLSIFYTAKIKLSCQYCVNIYIQVKQACNDNKITRLLLIENKLHIQAYKNREYSHFYA